MPALEVRDLHASYGAVEVLHGITLHLERAETLGILGSNGAGKSTLLHALAGLVRSRGGILLEGRPLSSLSPHERARRGLALVPEIRGNVFRALSVKENLQVSMRLLDVRARGALVDQVYSMFPILKDRGAALGGMLSGGEQQMLAIAMALGRQPSVLMLDEPTQGLAPSILDVLHAAFHQLKQQGIAILLAEQNLAFARRCADHVVVIAGGVISFTGNSAALGDAQTLLNAYMGQQAKTTNE
jgi:branched-chain amino acid transport system ATP-binding protein